MPSSRLDRIARLAAALLLAAPLLRAPDARAASLAALRLLEVGKDHAVVRIELSEPADAEVGWGEQPGSWAATSKSGGPAATHELRMAGLLPDRRYFYQVSVGGQPAGEMGTFLSGRSWVTRRARILATAAAPAATPESKALADRLFARESDVLVLLGGEGEPASMQEQLGRALADRVVTSGPASPAGGLPVGDVVLAWSGAAAGSGTLAEAEAAHGACWGVSLGGPADGAEVTLARGDRSAIEATADAMAITLTGHDSVELAFESGTLTATLTTAAGPVVKQLTRTCTVPAPPSDEPAMPDFEAEADAMGADGERAEAECDLP